jgi:transcriptional regulator with XRE-family HTH domain
MNFGEKLKMLRKKKNWTQKEAAEKLGVSSRTYAAYELQEWKPKDINQYFIFAKVFGVSKDYFLEIPNDLYDKQIKENKAEFLTNELITLFMNNELSSKVRDNIAERIMNAYWDAKKEDNVWE